MFGRGPGFATAAVYRHAGDGSNQEVRLRCQVHLPGTVGLFLLSFMNFFYFVLCSQIENNVKVQLVSDLLMMYW